MFRGIFLLLFTAMVAHAATLRLYLKDGEYQSVREFQVLLDRIRYYSVERGDWEEVPLELVDLKKTEAERTQRDQSTKEEAAALASEEKAEREAQQELERVPVEPGVYLVTGGPLKTIQPAETKITGCLLFTGQSKKRSILKVITPIPIVSGKGTLEIEGGHAPTVVTTDRPEFYIRLSAEERFGIVRMGEQKGNRVVERFEIIPVTKEIVEQQDEVQVFRRQAGDGLYKIWPIKPLTAGEYAVVEYSPATDGDLNIQVWDFGYAPAASRNR